MVTIAALLSLFQFALDPADSELQPLGKSSLSLRDDFAIRVMTRR